MPSRIRFDNGFPWGSTGDLPTELALWLIGLGVELIWNPPRQPQKNGVVERSQGTAKRWAEPQMCDSADELQERVNHMDRLQRAQYPRAGGRSRMELFPGLQHSGRRYERSEEGAQWNWDHVAQHLSRYTVGRRVDSAGLVYIYNRSHYVGKRWHGQTVYVSLDPQTREWLIRDAAGTQIRIRPADELAPERIVRLNVSGRALGKTNLSQLAAKTGVA